MKLNGKLAFGVIFGVIFLYYILATLLPIDKRIGRLYPYFGALLLISALGVGIGIVSTGAPIFPLIFFTITCGALSGFHATQTPIISRTIQNENQGRKIFYGIMIAEGIIAMIWAAVMSLFVGYSGLHELLTAGGPRIIVSEASTMMLGEIDGTLAVLGVVILPTSRDTAFRSARMIIAEYLSIA